MEEKNISKYETQMKEKFATNFKKNREKEKLSEEELSKNLEQQNIIF